MAVKLSELKEMYAAYEKKYKLPKFEDVNDIFEIDKIDKEGDRMLRVFRKVMMDKVLNSLSFFDMIFNPANAPRIYMPAIRSFNEDDKKTMDVIYNVWGNLALEVLELEVRYDEKKEAEMVKRIFKTWSGIQSDFLELMKKFSKPEEVKSKKSRGYFG